MHTHRIVRTNLAAVVIARLERIFFAGYSHLKRQPAHVYDVRLGKRPALFVRQRRELKREYERGMRRETILTALDEMRADVETWGTPTVVLDLRSAYLREVEGESQANATQARALLSDDEAELERALDVGTAEENHTRDLNRAVRHRLAQKRSERRAARRFFHLPPNTRPA